MFAGIAGVESDIDQFDLGNGITFKRTYAHFMAPFLMAPAPAQEGHPHPAPWSAVKGGLGFDIHVELHVPSEFDPPEFFDRLNTVWWLAALIRLRGASAAHVPVAADRSFSDIPQNWKKATILPVEALPRRLFAKPPLTRLSLIDFEWLKAVWLAGGKLMRDSSKFNDTFQAFDAAGALPNSSVALLAVWGALEHLFSPAKQELRFRVSAYIAAFLEPPGRARLELHQRLLKLYDARSGVAHGTRLELLDAWPDTYEIANRILTKIFSDNRVPSKENLDDELFSH